MLHHNEKVGPLRSESTSSADSNRGRLLDLVIMGLFIPLPIVAMIFGTVFFESKDKVKPASVSSIYQVRIIGSPEMTFEGTIRSDHPRSGLIIQDINGMTPGNYRIPAGKIECSVRKKDGTSGELSVEILKNGKLLAKGRTSDVFDKITLRQE